MAQTGFALNTTGNNGTGTAGTFQLGAGGEAVVASVIFAITGSSSLSATLKAQVSGSSQTAQNIQYVNIGTGAALAAGTAIMADGIYGCFAPSCRITLVVASGSATLCEPSTVLGKI